MGNFLQSVIVLFTLLISTAGAVQVVYAHVGETVNLKPLELSKSHRYVHWKFKDVQIAWRNHLGGKFLTNDIPWENKLKMSDDSLTIENLQKENFGTFQVSVDNQPPPISTITLVRVEVSKFPTSPLLPGELLSLTCSADVSKKPEIHWLDPRGERKTSSDGFLSTRVTAQHNGEWTCVVADHKHVRVPVTVVGLSAAPSHAQYTSTSMPISIPCSLSRHVSWEQIKAKDVQEVHWQFFPRQSSGVRAAKAQRLFFLSLESMNFTAEQNRDLRPLLEPATGNFTLARKRGRNEDAGDYVCTMSFKNGLTLNRTVHVHVLQIIASPGADVITGQLLNLTCSVGHPLPSDLRLEWSPPKQSPRSVHHSAHLTIPEVSTGDGGNWRCSLWEGKRRLTSAVITLSIESRLNVWMLVIICAAAVIVILLVVLIIILYRRRNRKMRHLRHQLCRCKHPKPKGFYRS